MNGLGAEIRLYDSNKYYEGYFENGLLNGFGRCIFEDKSKYIGQFKDGLYNG